MLSGVGYAISCQRPENRDFCFKWGALTVSRLCSRGFVKKAERVVRACNKERVGLGKKPELK